MLVRSRAVTYASRALLLAAAALAVGCTEPYSPGERLRRAALAGRVKEVEQLLSSNPALANNRDASTGMTPLEFAVISGSKSTVLALIKYGADVNASDGLRMCASAHAVRRNDRDMLKLLIKHGADVRASKVLTQRLTLLMVAASTGSNEVAQELLVVGVPVDALDNDGKKAVDHARENGHDGLAVILEQAERGNQNGGIQK